MPLHLRDATDDDLAAIGRIAAEAFHPSTDVITRTLFPPHLQSPDVSAGDAAGAWRFARKSASFYSSRGVMMVVVDDSLEGQVVGFALWEVPVRDSEAEEPPAQVDPPPGLDQEAYAETKRIVSSDAKKYFGERGSADVWHLDYIGVDPQHQRRGIGNVLLQWGLKEAAKQKKNCYLIATPAGQPLYYAAGFEDLGSVVVFGVPHFSMIKRNEPGAV